MLTISPRSPMWINPLCVWLQRESTIANRVWESFIASTTGWAWTVEESLPMSCRH